MEAGSTEHLGDLLFSQGRAESLQPLTRDSGTTRGNSLTGSKVWTRASLPASSIRQPQELMVLGEWNLWGFTLAGHRDLEGIVFHWLP
jgi:hypothetical protein